MISKTRVAVVAALVVTALSAVAAFVQRGQDSGPSVASLDCVEQMGSGG